MEGLWGGEWDCWLGLLVLCGRKGGDVRKKEGGLLGRIVDE